jgi:hypothetical protein
MVKQDKYQVIADACGLTPRTVEKYYRGNPLSLASTVLIERACFELGYPYADSATFGSRKKRTKHTIGVK